MPSALFSIVNFIKTNARLLFFRSPRLASLHYPLTDEEALGRLGVEGSRGIGVAVDDGAGSAAAASPDTSRGGGGYDPPGGPRPPQDGLRPRSAPKTNPGPLIYS